MNLWMSLPAVYLPSNNCMNVKNGLSSFYNSIYAAYSKYLRKSVMSYNGPSAEDMYSEELAVKAIKQLEIDDNVSLLIDCRSSVSASAPASTYKIAIESGLNNVLPFSIQRLRGTEVVQSIKFLQNMPDISNKIIIVGTQRLLPGDQRVRKKHYSLADASMAFYVTQNQDEVNEGFQIVAADISRIKKNVKAVLDATLNKCLKFAHLTRDVIGWMVIHQDSQSFTKSIKDNFPDINLFFRDINPYYNFGCADPFITLNRIFRKKLDIKKKTGLVWVNGLNGTIGCMLLKYRNGVNKNNTI